MKGYKYGQKKKSAFIDYDKILPIKDTRRKGTLVSRANCSLLKEGKTLVLLAFLKEIKFLTILFWTNNRFSKKLKKA